MPTISNEDLFEVTTLVYNRWSGEYDLLKQVKAETDDGSERDWVALHAIRLHNHITTEAKWKALLQRLTTQLPQLHK